MNRIATSTLTKLVVLVSALCALSVEAASVTTDADTLVRKGDSTTNFGTDDSMRTKNANGSTTRVSIFRFDTTTLGDLSGGIILELTTSDHSGYSVDETMHLYGVTDGSALQNFVESGVGGLTWDLGGGAFDTSYALEIKDDDGFFYDADGGVANEQALASFTVVSNDVTGTTYTIAGTEGSALAAFANASTDEFLTFVLVRGVTSDKTRNLQWATKENATCSAPTLIAIDPDAPRLVADTFVRSNRSTENYGKDPIIRAKNGSNTRVSILRFDSTGIDLSNDEMSLNLTVDTSDSSRTFHVFGLVDEAGAGDTVPYDVENFVEGTGTQATAGIDGLVWDDSDVFAKDAGGGYNGVDNTAGYFYDPDGDTPYEQALASFTVETTAGTTYTITSEAMLDFAKADGNNLLSFIVVREGSSTANIYFASKEHASLDVPQLTLRRHTGTLLTIQ